MSESIYKATVSNPFISNQNIYLVSSNPNKASEINDILSKLNPAINISTIKIDLPELQLYKKDMRESSCEITKEKVKSCWSQIYEFISDNKLILSSETMFIIEDSSFYLLDLADVPGPYIKGFNSETLIKMTNNNKRNAEAMCYFSFFLFDPNKIDSLNNEIDLDKIHIISGSCLGTISNEIRGNGGFGWDNIFIPDIKYIEELKYYDMFENNSNFNFLDKYKNKTFSEIIDISTDVKNLISQRKNAINNLYPFIEEFLNNIKRKNEHK